MIEAVAVDLGGVAAAFHPERRLRALAERSGIAPAVIHERLFTSGLDARAERGEIPFDALAEQICAALEGRLETSEIIDCWASAFEPLEAVLVSVASIRVATVLLTNNGPVINACLDGPLSAIAVEFDRVVCSWQLGACKPERTAFDRAAVLLGRRGVPVLGADDGPLVRAPRRGRPRTSIVAVDFPRPEASRCADAGIEVGEWTAAANASAPLQPARALRPTRAEDILLPDDDDVRNVNAARTAGWQSARVSTPTDVEHALERWEVERWEVECDPTGSAPD